MATIPSAQEVNSYREKLSNWGRWGEDDQIGTLNLLTPQKTAQAVALVKSGRTVTCARPIIAEAAPDVRIPPLHFTWHTREEIGEGSGGSMDFLGVAYHGSTVTHLDSSCHSFWDGKMYNGRSASLVSALGGAKAGHIDLVQNGIVGRAVLLDIARLRGVEWMEPSQGIMPEDLDKAEQEYGVRVGEGDILLLRTGNYKRRLELGPRGDGGAGPQAALLPWLRERDITVLGSDTPNDVFPMEYPELGLPLHFIGIGFMGLWLLDNANLEDLSQACQEEGRWEFLLTINPLRIANGTGSPVNPVAVF